MHDFASWTLAPPVHYSVARFMISHFKVEGFKSLVDVDVDLGAVNIFIGANGSGKSNLLEAIGVMGAAAFGSVEPETLRYRGVRLGLPALYKTSLSVSHIPRLIKLEAKTGRATYRVALDNPIKSPSVRWRIANETLEESEIKVLGRSPRGVTLLAPDGTKEDITPDPYRTLASLALARRDNAAESRYLIDELKDFAIYAPTTSVL